MDTLTTFIRRARPVLAAPAVISLMAGAVFGQSPRPTPCKDWGLQAYLLPARDADEFGLRLQKDPDAAFTFAAASQQLRGTVRAVRGRETSAQVLPLPEPPPVPEYGPLHRRGESPGEGITWVGLRWRTDGLAPGLYTLKVSVPVRATDAGTGLPVTLPDAQASTDVYLPPPPDKAPALTPGQKFLCLPNADESLSDYRDTRGRPVPPAGLMLKVWTLTRVARTGKWPVDFFRVEGHAGEVGIENGGPLSALPGLKPLVEDATLRGLRARYEGRQVWGLGGIGAQCVSAQSGQEGSFGADARRPVRIVRLVRIARADVHLAMGGQIGAMGGDRQSEFVTRNPLVAVLALPRGLGVTGVSVSGRGGGADGAMRLFGTPERLCAAYALYADAWDFERAYSLAPPWKAHPEWPRAMAAAVRKGELRKGMKPEMAAWVMGYPAEYGTARELSRRALGPKAAWRYDNLSPYSFWIYFHGGCVVSFGPDGQLP